MSDIGCVLRGGLMGQSVTEKVRWPGEHVRGADGVSGDGYEDRDGADTGAERRQRRGRSDLQSAVRGGQWHILTAWLRN